MVTQVPISPKLQLARAVRERFLAEAGKAMVEVGEAVLERLTTLMDEPASARDNQIRRDCWMAYKKCRPVWLESTMKVWRECLVPPLAKKAAAPEVAGLQLVGAEVVENKILASRMVLAVMEKVSSKFEDLKVRIRFLEGSEDLETNDLFRPEVLVLMMVEQWANSGMPGDSWSMVNGVVQALLQERLTLAYENANDVLIKKGVLPTIELSDRVKAPVHRAPSRPGPGGAVPPLPDRNTSPANDQAGGGPGPQPGYPQQGSGQAVQQPGEARAPRGGFLADAWVGVLAPLLRKQVKVPHRPVPAS